jgi:hypothetical protein
MPYETINTHEAVKLFEQVLQPDSQIRVLRLVGNAKMGKSHLLTKVFPSLARAQYQARYAILDVRNQMYTVPDILQMACSQFGSEGFINFDAAQKAWTNRPKVSIANVFALFASLSVSAKDSSDDTHNRDRHLTNEFVKDVRAFTDKVMVLFFDSVDSATENIQDWLMDTFVVQVSQLAHVRIVVAGRSLPEAHGSYAANCRSYQLLPVTSAEEYISYCRLINARLEEQSIRDIARLLDYTPGMFVDLVVPKFAE